MCYYIIFYYFDQENGFLVQSACTFPFTWFVNQRKNKLVTIWICYRCTVCLCCVFQVKKLLTELEFILVPVGNPDGYAVSVLYTVYVL